MTDYIDREAIMQAFIDYVWNSRHSYLVPTPRWNHAVEIVRDFPAADVKPVVRGEWMPFDDGENTYYCSACKEPWVLIDGTPRENGMYFCPNCGADMRKENE